MQGSKSAVGGCRDQRVQMGGVQGSKGASAARCLHLREWQGCVQWAGPHDGAFAGLGKVGWGVHAIIIMAPKTRMALHLCVCSSVCSTTCRTAPPPPSAPALMTSAPKYPSTAPQKFPAAR